MARYADVTCDKCYQVYPGNMMKRVTDRVKTGETRTPNGRLEDRIEQYGELERTLCPECMASRRRSSCAIWLLMIGIPAGYFGLSAVPELVRSGSLPKNDITRPLAVAGKSVNEFTNRVVKTSESGKNSSGGFSSPEQANVESTTGTGTQGASSADAESIDQTSSEEATKAIQVAGSTGKRTKWRNDVSKGYAVPSTPNEVGCRNVYITDKKMGKNWQSPVQTVCP